MAGAVLHHPHVTVVDGQQRASAVSGRLHPSGRDRNGPGTEP
jgi:hypothetical protein